LLSERDEKGERIPLTIADWNRQKGTVTVVFMEVGKTTRKLATLKQGEYIAQLRRSPGPAHPYRQVWHSGLWSRRLRYRHYRPNCPCYEGGGEQGCLDYGLSH